MADLKRVRYVTANYAQLQGLRLVPVGVPFLVSAAWRCGWLGWWPGAGGADAGQWFVLMLAAAVAVSYLIGTSYHAQFGEVRPLPGRSGAATLILSFVVFMVLGWLQDRFGWQGSVPVMFVGVALFRLGLAAGALRKHYLVLACVCMMFALSTWTGSSPRRLAVSRDLLIGVGLILAGIGDDRVLRRVLQPPDSDEYASAL